MKFKKLTLFTLLALFLNNQCQASALENLLTTPTGLSIVVTSCASIASFIAYGNTKSDLLDNRKLENNLNLWDIPRHQLRLINPKLESSRARYNESATKLEQALINNILIKNNEQGRMFLDYENKYLSTYHNLAVFISTMSCGAAIYLAQKNKFAHATPASGFYSGMSLVASIFSVITADVVNSRIEHIINDGKDAFLKKYPQTETADNATEALKVEA